MTLALEYSTDAGVTWTPAASVTAFAVARRELTLQSAFEAAFARLPAARYLQVRVTWSSVSDWAPVLTGIWAEIRNCTTMPRHVAAGSW